MTVKTCRKIIPAIWCLAITTATPTMIEYRVMDVTNGNATHSSCASYVSRTYSVVNGALLLWFAYVVPLVLMYYNYFKIIRFVLQRSKIVGAAIGLHGSKELQNGTDGPGADTDQSGTQVRKTQSVLFKKRIKIVKMLIIVAALFAISWLPYFVSLTIAVSLHFLFLFLFR